VELAASYRCVEEVARTRARNFYYSFVLLPEEKRRAFCAVYAFMRHCDDASDGTGALQEKRKQLELWRGRLDAAAAGQCQDDPILPAFHDSIRRFAIPVQYFHWIIDGTEMDLVKDRYQTFEELYRYCFHVASAVGLVSLHIFGFTDERAKKYAEECGIAFQLTNILRDLKEDAAMGRIYLPTEDLNQFQYSEDDLRRGTRNENFQRMMQFECIRAQSYYDRAQQLLPLVDAVSRPALWAMMEIYGRILGKIQKQRYDVFGRRVRLSGLEKMAIAAKSFGMRYFDKKKPEAKTSG
jgi:phytoene synthase